MPLNLTEKLVILKITQVRKSGDRTRLTKDLDLGIASFGTWWKLLGLEKGSHAARQTTEEPSVRVAIDHLQELSLIVRGSKNAASIAAGTGDDYFLTKLGHDVAFDLGRVQGRYGWRPVRPTDARPIAPANPNAHGVVGQRFA